MTTLERLKAHLTEWKAAHKIAAPGQIAEAGEAIRWLCGEIDRRDAEREKEEAR